MKLRGSLAAALAAVLLGAAPRPVPLTVYSAPNAARPAGASRLEATDAVLPDGRTAAPFGSAIFVGTNPLGVALSPNGRFAVVTNDEQNPSLAPPPPPSAADLRAGYSLVVVDTATMRVASIYQAPGLALYCGVAVMRDPAEPSKTIVLASDGANNAVRIFDLQGDGTLVPEAAPIPVPGFPSDITVSRDGRVAYVSSNLGGTVASIDIAARKVLGTAAVGFSPFGVARAGSNLYVANGGLDMYAPLSPAARTPRFANVSGSTSKSSSLSIVPLGSDGELAATGAASVVRMDPIPDGAETVGGAHPGAVVTRNDDRYAYVTLSNVDRISTVALQGDPHVIGGLDIRLFVNAPYGTQPDAEALSPDGQRLYVALAGLNAIAVLDAHDPATLHRLGLIPTGAFPSSLALSRDGRYLYVTSARGVDGWGLLQRVDLKKLSKTQLVKATLAALRYNRAVAAAKPNSVVPPLRSKRKSSVIDRVVYISVGAGTYDSVLGDVTTGNGDASLAINGAAKTPNLHALAEQYASADNFYAEDMNADLDTQYALAGVATAHAERTLHVNSGRVPFDAHGQDPEDYPRSGYLFNAMQRSELGFRDYGGLLQVSGYEPFAPQAGGRGRPARAVDASSLGGQYTLNVPALAALDGHVDLNYPGWNPNITNAQRADEFVKDMGALVAADQEPAFTYVALPVADPSGMSDADRAVGTIVGFLSHTPHWSSTAVFIVGGTPAGTSDHVNRARTLALVVSPLAKQHFVGHHHLSIASVVKTEEELLGLPPLSLRDLLASDMAEFFGDVPYPTTYQPAP